MKKHNLKINVLLQIMYQVIILVIPLITAPYLTRHLGDNGLGNYTFSYTIAYYFVLLGMLGINKYGQRLISTNTSDEFNLRKNFWSLYLAHFIFSIFSLFLYEILILFIGKEYYKLYLIQSIYVFSAVFDITWLFYGLENFKSIVIRNAFLKMTECLMIFLLVKNENDLWIYTLITSLSVFFGQLVMIPVAIKYIKPISITWRDIFKHVKPLLTFSIMVLASLLYSVFDKTLLGILSTKEDVAYYEYANKIVNVPKTIAIVIGTVIYPRACKKIKDNNFNDLEIYYKISLIFTYFIAFASISGLLALGDEFAVLYYGQNFSKCGSIMKFMSPIILLITIDNIFQNLYIVPMGEEKKLNKAIVLGAIINLFLSTILIIFLSVNGVILGTLISEGVLLVLNYIICRKKISIKNTFMLMIPFVVSGIIMYFLIIILKRKMTLSYLNFFGLVLIAGLVYFVCIILYFLLLDKDRNYYKNIIKKG